MAIIRKTSPVSAQLGKLTEGDIQVLLSHYLCSETNYVFPNVLFGSSSSVYSKWEMDFAVITKSGFLWEIEIKTSKADWENDAKKRKWNSPYQKYISRFYYCVPESLISHIPKHVKPSMGILVAHPGRGVSEYRAARRYKAKKLTDEMRMKFLYKTYYKFWDLRRNHQRRRLKDLHITNFGTCN